MSNVFVRKILICVAALCVLAACSQDPAALMRRAEDRETKGDYIAAIVDLKSVLQQEPNNGIARYRLGRVNNLIFDGLSAEKELRRASELGVVEGGRVALELGRSLVLQQKPKEIIEVIVPSAAFEPSILTSSYAVRGHAYLTLGQIKEAQNEYDQAQKIDPENADLLLLQARFKAGGKDLAGAVELVDKVLARDSKNFEAWTYKVDLLAFQGKQDEMLQAYEYLLKVNPRHLDALVGRANLLLRQQKPDEAQKDVDVLGKVYPRHPVTGFLQGYAHFAKGRFRDALEAAQGVLKRNPDYDQALLLSGMAHLALGAVAQAERELAQYVSRNPRNAYARRVLATAQVELGQGSKALETLDPILRSGLKDAAVLALAGDAYSRIGEYSKAAEWIERSVATSPENPLALAQQARIRMASGQIDMAISDLERISTLSKGITHADTALVLLHIARREHDKAMGAILVMEQKSPKSPQPANLRGLVLLDKGDREAAARSFEASVKLDPRFVPAVVNLAKLDLAAGNSERARKRFETVLRLDEKNVQALLAYAGLEEVSGRTREAMTLFERAVKVAPGALEPKIRLARLVVQANDKQRARAIADEAFASNPDHPMAIELLGGVQMWTGDHNSGIATLSRLTSLFPKSPESFYKLAGAQLVAGRVKDAEANLRRAIALDFPPAESILLRVLADGRVDEALDFVRGVQKEFPKSPRGYLYEAELWATQNKHREAIGPLRTALGLRASGDTAAKLFRARAASGDRAAAMTDLRAWVDKHPKDRVARTELAGAFMQDRDFKTAATHFEQVLKGGPSYPHVLNNLAWAYFNLKDTRAQATAETAYKYAPNSPEVGDTLGWILVEHGQLDRGLKILEKAVAGAPANPEIRFHWAAALAKSGKNDLARKELTALLAANKAFPQADEAATLLAQLK